MASTQDSLCLDRHNIPWLSSLRGNDQFLKLVYVYSSKWCSITGVKQNIGHFVWRILHLLYVLCNSLIYTKVSQVCCPKHGHFQLNVQLYYKCWCHLIFCLVLLVLYNIHSIFTAINQFRDLTGFVLIGIRQLLKEKQHNSWDFWITEKVGENWLKRNQSLHFRAVNEKHYALVCILTCVYTQRKDIWILT